MRMKKDSSSLVLSPTAIVQGTGRSWNWWATPLLSIRFAACVALPVSGDGPWWTGRKDARHGNLSQHPRGIDLRGRTLRVHSIDRLSPPVYLVRHRICFLWRHGTVERGHHRAGRNVWMPARGSHGRDR